MKDRKTKNRIAIGTLAALLIISIISCVIFHFTPSTDYTSNYNVFCAVKDVNSTYELMDYCHANSIQYSINRNVFRMENCYLTFSLNNAECKLDNNRHMNNLWLLVNQNCHDTIKTYENEDGTTDTSYVLKTWGTNYENRNGSYLVCTTWPILISIAAAIIFAISLIQQICMTSKKSVPDADVNTYENDA